MGFYTDLEKIRKNLDVIKMQQKLFENRIDEALSKIEQVEQSNKEVMGRVDATLDQLKQVNRPA